MGPQVALPRRRFNVHPIQRKYFSLFLAPLLFFTSFLILFTILVPSDVIIQGTTADPGQAQIVGRISALLDLRIWLALLVSMIASGLLSYVVTNKFAGPLYRIEQMLRRGKDGDLPLAVRVRSDDELQELVELLDGTFKKFASALTAIHEQQHLAITELTAVQRKVKAELDGEVGERLERVDRHLREVENILANFKVPMPQVPTPEPRD